MGIRFLCDSCQKRLNVKAKQAGEFCVCPDCETEIQVPLESTIESPIEPATKRAKKRQSKRRPNVEVDCSPVMQDQLLVELEAVSESSAVIVDAFDGADNHQGGESAAADLQIEQVTLVDSAAVRSPSLLVTPKKFRQQVEQVQNEEVQIDDPKTPASSVDRFDLAEHQAQQSKTDLTFDKLFSDDASYEDDESGEADSFLLAKPVIKIQSDPLMSDPKLVWYLRHKRFGEKGPLKARQVEAMLESGQLRSGYIVWREDWNDWLPAEEVFPKLVVLPELEAACEIPYELNPLSEMSRKRRAQKRFWVGFNVAAFLLVIVLVYWLTHYVL